MKKINIIVFVLALVFITSCQNWLSIDPSDRVTEKKAFSTIAGFKKSLNGIYVELNNENLYGKALSTEFVEILAQRYAINEGNTLFTKLKDYDYKDDAVKERLASIWSTAYNLIANANLVIKNADLQKGKVLPIDYYDMIKGEALALRAMLHFDLFRLFGYMYDPDSTTLSIPYYTEFSLQKRPIEPGTVIMHNVISDLSMADSLLKGVDPIIRYGVSGDPVDNFKQFRNLRLNYYAVKLLEARAYLYMGLENEAFECANVVIEAQPEKFPFVDIRTISSSDESPDKIFSTELLFALQNENRNSMYYQFFDATALKLENMLPIRQDVADYIFTRYSGSTSDYRYKAWMNSTEDFNGVPYVNNTKLLGKDSLYSKMVPMLRVTEAYLIGAETLYTPDRAWGRDLLTAVRNARGLSDTPSNSYSSYLKYEYIKEFWCEGQLFFFYKRWGSSSMVGADETYQSVYVNSDDYVLPIPDEEINFN